MSVDREYLKTIIDRMPNHDVSEVLAFVHFLEMKREKQLLHNVNFASETSTSFWDNPIDDGVWNDV